MTDFTVPSPDPNLFDLSKLNLPAPVRSVLTPELARALPSDTLTELTPRLLRSDSQTAPNAAFAGLPSSRQWSAPASTLNPLTVSAPRVDRNYQRNLTSLENKYNELEPFINSLPEDVRAALIDLDTTRVSRGSAPLTREQTINAAATAVSNTPATEAPDRASGFTGFFRNIGADLSDILKSIPRLPTGIVHEITELPRISDRITEAQDAGANPLTALLQAPGIRMLPGAYTLSNIASGDIGQLQQHPLFTALDLLPYGNRAAASTRTATAVQAAREQQIARLSGHLGRELPTPPPRPISAVLNNRVTPAGDITRTALGRTVDFVAPETPFGQQLSSAFGRTSRDIARNAGWYDQRLKMLLLGHGAPQNQLESLATRVAPMFDRWADTYPALSTRPPKTPAAARQAATERAALYDTLTTAPDTLHPGFVNDMRDLLNDVATFEWNQGKLGQFDNEFYPTAVADKLLRGQSRIDTSTQFVNLRNHYLNPSPTAIPTIPNLVSAVDLIKSTANRANPQFKMDLARALENTLDAYGIDITPLRSARAGISTGKSGWDTWHTTATNVLNGNPTFAPRRTLTDIIATLRQHKADYQAGRLEAALKNGDVTLVTRTLDNLYKRKPPTFPDAIYPALRDDIRSMSRRQKFDLQVGKRYERAHQRRVTAFERMRNRNAPARFGPTIEREVYGYRDPTTGTVTAGTGTARVAQEASQTLGVNLTPEQLGTLAANVYDRQWAGLPGLDPKFVSDTIETVRKETAETWRTIRAGLTAEQQPVFVHKVTPHRAQEVFTGKVGPVPTDETHLAERAVDLTPDAMRDLQVSVTHQIGESLQRSYSEQFIQDVIARVGVSETDLQAHYLNLARRTAAADPTLTARGWLQKLTRDSYRRFNPEEAGFSWGGARFNNFYKDNAYYIPTAVYNNLKRYAKQPSIFTSLMDPVTKMFRYNVIGLSPSVVINNFFSNAVAMTAERGLRPWKHFRQAWEWTKDPTKIPVDDLRGLALMEQPHLEHLGMDAYLATRTGQRVSLGFNSAKAFQDSAFAEAARLGKNRLDVLARKNLLLQRLGDNVYRSMIYLDAIERGAIKGASKAAAHSSAMDLVRRVLVDYSSFTPIEQNAIRSIIPFYSYMGHAARFVFNYPLNHPMRAFVVSRIGALERERLGALPGSFLSFLPIGSPDNLGNLTMFNLRPFDPFGDQSDLLSVAGWVAAMNPAIQVALRQIGVTRGEAELYPTLRYNAETGRMEAVRPNVLTDLLMSAAPRVGLLASLTGLNPDYNELRTRDPDAANRSLLAQAGIPRLWREFNVPQEMMRAELTRYQVSQDVLNDALKSGNWAEAMRYPSLRAYYDQLLALAPEQLEAMVPAEAESIAGVIGQQLQ
jgi:hypothetical protein